MLYIFSGRSIDIFTPLFSTYSEVTPEIVFNEYFTGTAVPLSFKFPEENS